MQLPSRYLLITPLLKHLAPSLSAEPQCPHCKKCLGRNRRSDQSQNYNDITVSQLAMTDKSKLCSKTGKHLQLLQAHLLPLVKAGIDLLAVQPQKIAAMLLLPQYLQLCVICLPPTHLLPTLFDYPGKKPGAKISVTSISCVGVAARMFLTVHRIHSCS